MAFKPRSNCATCEKIQAGDKRLFERINQSRAFVPGGESLRSIAADVGLTYESLFNHSKKHQAPNATKLAKRKKEFETKEAFKEIELTGERRKLSAYTNQRSARSELIDRLLEMADKGELKLTGNNLVSLLAQAQKEEEAAKDRNLELMKMFNYFASGTTTTGNGNIPRSADYEEAEIISG